MYPRFYYPEGISDFWSDHVTGPLCKPKSLDLIDITRFDQIIDTMVYLFTCNDSEIENLKKYGKITDDMPDHQYKEMKFWWTVGIGQEDALEEFVCQVASAIANTSVSIWLKSENSKNENEQLVRFINHIDIVYKVYWMEELIPLMEKMCGKTFPKKVVLG